MPRIYTIKTNMERFAPKMGEPTENGCQPFLGHICKSTGYGSFAWRDKGALKLRSIGAHVASYLLFKEPVPDQLLVRHSCDNRACVSPKHLLLGTQVDNMRDCIQRRRTATGERQGGAKLTWEKVREIRRRYEEGETQVALAVTFGVKQPNISRILRGETWRDVT